MRVAAYAGVSVTLAAGVVLKAMHQRPNFYSACVYLSQSNANLMILTNLCLLVTGFVLFGLQRLLYGRLRPIETEQLYEKAWFAVTETCLAMTVFRGNMGAWFIVMFVCLLVGKVWGWIGEGRVEILEQQPPNNPRLFHTRLAISLIMAVMFNSFMLEYAVKTVLRQARPDMMVMFGFEFAVLTVLSFSTAARYGISLVEIQITRQQRRQKLEERRAEIRAARDEALRQAATSTPQEQPVDIPDENDIDEMELEIPGWEEKGRWIFYLDLVTDFIKLVVYIAFFAILFTFYGLPLHILRDVVMTMRSFAKRIVDFLRYRNATRDMNERYPDATAEEVEREDVCIICREEMRPWQPPAGPAGAAPGGRPAPTVSDRLRPKKLPCGHILHFACLRSWLERQQNCPTCRRPVATVSGARVSSRGVGQGENAAAAGQAQAPGGNQAAAPNVGDRPRAWFLNMGPIRIGFGAGRGDVLQNLAHQAQGQPQNPNANQPAAGPQQYGFGFGFGRPAAVQPAQQPPAFNPNNIQAQLQQIEQHVTQEMNNLRATAEQLQVVRLLQGELARLRSLQTNPAAAGTPGQPATQTNPLTNAAQASNPAALTATASSSHTLPFTNHRQFTSNPQQPALSAGDVRLPDGLTLPQGWTLLPLQQAGSGQQPAQAPYPSNLSTNLFPTPSAASTLSAPHSHSNPSSNQTVTSARTRERGRAPSPLSNPSERLGTLPSISATAIPSSTRAVSSTRAQVPASQSNENNSSTGPADANSSWVNVTSDSLPGSQGLHRRSKPDVDPSKTNGPNSAQGDATAVESEPGSSSKGKARAATVEDVDDEQS